MKVVGFSERSFTAKDTGALIEGMTIYVSFENNRIIGTGCDRFFISRKRLAECDYSPSIGDDIEPLYNRFGKITGIRLM